jgi:hypothetical protein
MRVLNVRHSNRCSIFSDNNQLGRKFGILGSALFTNNQGLNLKQFVSVFHEFALIFL